MSLLVAMLGFTGASHAGVVPGDAADLDSVYAPRRVAVMVGVQDYDDPRLQGLRFPAKDARDLGAALRDPGAGGFDRVVVVDGEAETTADAIERAIRAASADLQRDDTFVLYLSGHGTLTLDPALGSRLWFLPSDGRLDSPEQTGISIAELEAWVADLPARRRVLVMDTCHNGRTTGPLAGRSAINPSTQQRLAGLRGEAPAPRGLREVSESEARLFAAQYHQPAMEDPELENGVYTHYLLQSITARRSAADLDGDGLVDVAEAHDYARDKTIAHTGGMQVPRAEYRIVGKEEIWLAGDASRRTRAEHALLSGVDEVLSSARVLVDGIPRGPAVGLTAISPGRHAIEVQSDDGRTLARKTLKVEAGDTVPVEDLFRSQRSQTFVALGASVVHGRKADAWTPIGGELELGWSVQRSRSLRWGVHGRTLVGGGTLEDVQGPGTTGLVSFGASAGWGPGRLGVGPLLEVGLPWRTFDDGDGVASQAALTAQPGARATWMTPMGGRALVVRYDTRLMPWRYEASWTSVWHHGVAVGLTTR
ncbi:MAG: caspase family protein [Myxococcota bacterium]|nr:caspase family protein [Myxococcota bacterium]